MEMGRDFVQERMKGERRDRTGPASRQGRRCAVEGEGKSLGTFEQEYPEGDHGGCSGRDGDGEGKKMVHQKMRSSRWER